MFDIGFTELLLVAVVALVVVGPKDLPVLIGKVARFLGRARQLVNSVKSELDREVSKTEELKRLLSEQQDILARHQRVMEQPHVIAVPPASVGAALAPPAPFEPGSELAPERKSQVGSEPSPPLTPVVAPAAAPIVSLAGSASNAPPVASPVPPRSIPAGGSALAHGPAPD